MTTLDLRTPGPAASRFSVTPAHGVRADDGAAEAAATVARYLCRLGAAVGQMLDVGELVEMHLTAPTATAVVLFAGPESMQGALGRPGASTSTLRAIASGEQSP